MLRTDPQSEARTQIHMIRRIAPGVHPSWDHWALASPNRTPISDSKDAACRRPLSHRGSSRCCPYDPVDQRRRRSRLPLTLPKARAHTRIEAGRGLPLEHRAQEALHVRDQGRDVVAQVMG